MRNAYKILIIKPESKIRLGIRMHRLEDNIKVDMKCLGYESVTWINRAQGESSGCLKNHRDPLSGEEFLHRRRD